MQRQEIMTAEERQGLAWWNNLNDWERRAALAAAGHGASIAEAYRVFLGNAPAAPPNPAPRALASPRRNS